VSRSGWIAPPLAVLIRFGFGRDFFVNILCTVCGYFPGHFHNFYCQTIRNNSKSSRTPKWAIKYGLVKVKDKRGGRHQWAGRYDERLPDSARYDYEDGASVENASFDNDPSGPGPSAPEWDGRGPEPRHSGSQSNVGKKFSHNGNTRNFLSPWDNEVDLEDIQGEDRARPGPSAGRADADPLDNEQFYNSSLNTHDGIATHATGNQARKKKTFAGVRGILGSHKDRYAADDGQAGGGGDRFDRMKANRGTSSSYAPPDDEYQDDFERELNTGYKPAPVAPKPLRSQPTGYAPGVVPPKPKEERARFVEPEDDGFQDEFERELNTGRRAAASSGGYRAPATAAAAAAPLAKQSTGSRYDTFERETIPKKIVPQRTGRAEEGDGDRE